MALDHEFKMRVFSRRWGHPDSYLLKKTNQGWFVHFQHHKGYCDKTGSPFLFKALDHDSINYPEALGGYMEWLWETASTENMGVNEIQEQLDILAEWISVTEKSSPKGFFEVYK